jgi:hypothetical protein
LESFGKASHAADPQNAPVELGGLLSQRGRNWQRKVEWSRKWRQKVDVGGLEREDAMRDLIEFIKDVTLGNSGDERAEKNRTDEGATGNCQTAFVMWRGMQLKRSVSADENGAVIGEGACVDDRIQERQKDNNKRKENIRRSPIALRY